MRRPEINEVVAVHGCRSSVPVQQEGTVVHVTPTGRISVLLKDGTVVKFDKDGFQLGREHADYAISLDPE